MGRIYYAPFDNIAVTTDPDQDIWEIATTATQKVVLHAFELTSASITAEFVRLRLLRRTASGNGAAVVEVQADQDDAATSTVVEQLALIPGAIGDILMGFQWEQLGPLIYLPTPEMRPVVQQNGFLALNLQSALAATTNWSGYLVYEET